MSVEAVTYNGLGIIGSVLLLFGFYRVNSGRWTNKSLWYEIDNILGAGLIIAYQIHYHAYVSVVVNAIWAMVAVTGISVFFRRLHARKKRATRPKA